MHALASFFALGRKAAPISSVPLGGEAPEPLDEATFAAWGAWAARADRDGEKPGAAPRRVASQPRHEPSTAS
jgi:hypothetical protein